MSNKTNLQANNAALNGYIARIDAAREVAANLPEAGGDNGVSLDTCTVNLSGNLLGYLFLGYTTVENGEIQGKLLLSRGSAITSITCLCNSVLFIRCATISVSANNLTMLYNGQDGYGAPTYAFQVPSTKGATASIYLPTTGGGGAD